MQIKGAFFLVGVTQFYSVQRVSSISSTYMDPKSIFNAKFKSLSNFPSFIKLTSLEIGKEYKINRFSNLKTVYGDRFTVDIQVSNDAVARIILPERYQTLSRDLSEINNLLENSSATLTYLGGENKSNSVSIDFK
jgi:hypothetical protein